jgi:hypothetical protein
VLDQVLEAHPEHAVVTGLDALDLVLWYEPADIIKVNITPESWSKPRQLSLAVNK